MGIATVAVYSEADRAALHVREADEAVPIGPAEAAHSYLDIERIVGAARESGAEAVHPGYGFLSQNGDFAEAVERAGLVFIGPAAGVHRHMGDKQAARKLMAAAGVPVVPGDDGDDQSEAALLAAAKRVGWPVLIKPSRGGGGKGLRVVRAAAEFASALEGSRREARAAFGDDRVVLERFVERPRHVEVQVLGDAQGTLLHLFERECSIQRRHQKIVEETPSPALDAGLRARLCAAGVAAARAAGYVNAGTVEFLLTPAGEFYFLEMNTRLQVEHPVTEAVTGLDLVRLQLEIAAGRPLPLAQADVVSRGHALECRLYAEDPDRGDLPAPGKVLHLAAPEGPGVRFDSGVDAGSEVTVHYDPLLAKVITWGADRTESIERMGAALARTAVLGVTTNHARLRAIVDHAAFRAGALHTGFVDEHLVAAAAPLRPPVEAVAAAVAALRRPPGQAAHPAAAPDPWAALGPWRLGEVGAASALDVRESGPGTFVLRAGPRVETFHCVRAGDEIHLFWRGTVYGLRAEGERSRAAHRPAASGLEAAMPGRVIAVKAAPGQRVARGEELLVVESMKMENAIRAPREGTVKSVAVKVGDMVNPGVVLVEME
jgi:3-methylcrotonyl-CoA carboxylase alpha subunit